MITARAWAGKHYAVYGLARSGLATVRALVASGAKVTAWDEREEARAQAGGAELLDLNAADLSRFDSLVVSPGVPLNTHPLAARARGTGVEIIGDVELFARARPELPPHKVVGITGTNGKSTTTALVHHILATAGVPTTMGGNIGLPILAQDPLPDGGVYVLELSSYQIDLTQSLDCDVAVLLNITPDHLDRYESFEAYAASKARLFTMQSSDQTALVDWKTYERGLVDPVAGFNGLALPEWIERADWPALQGPHNVENAAAAIEAAAWLGVSSTMIVSALYSYPGLAHRMERVRERDGVMFVNDSKATNAEAAAPALAAYPRIRWIVGGQAKTKELGDTARHLDHVVHAYTIGEAGPMFARLLRDRGVQVTEAETLENAVKGAAADSQAGEVVLLSPACASFDQFRDFEARGDAFKRLVGDL
ncbi:Mur ligase family protein [Sphingomonas sp. BN140010]|uniref:UDP-N-acetylmuramoylalanine--D-glutamate ligase n=1 Tax=Sphingomonas arvum TaxID=2992113 RepID=A0ABT3JH61_9SPHN|nr:UDP-N-acetylmuramoyl-L-alanine--D-glutamate ligase [Sphingomonas sp. BN140010]MCW3798331.1 Mur ligase family protein [Sphingomonas sp. BN140010]